MQVLHIETRVTRLGSWNESIEAIIELIPDTIKIACTTEQAFYGGKGAEVGVKP